jgi:hypothetical protein
VVVYRRMEGEIQYLLLIRSWNGNTGSTSLTNPLRPSESPLAPAVIGPDLWSLKLYGDWLLGTSFSNMPAEHQAFPDWYGAGDYVRWTGSAETNSLGFTYEGNPMHSIYRFELLLPHTRPDLIQLFEALGLQDLLNESWGLDDVRAEIYDEPLFRNYHPLFIK